MFGDVRDVRIRVSLFAFIINTTDSPLDGTE